MRLSRLFAGCLVGAFVVAAGLYFVFGQQDEAAPNRVTVDLRWIDATPRLLVADDFGSVVLVENLLRGVDRSGSTVWQQSSVGAAHAPVCVGRCPAAVLSGDTKEFGDDPAPVLYGGATLPPGWSAPTGGANSILAAGPGGSLRMVSGADGVGRLEALTGGGTSSTPFPGSVVGWQQLAADGRSGTLFAAGGSTAYPWPVFLASRGAKGWTLTGPYTARACRDGSGTRTVTAARMTIGGHDVDLPAEVDNLPCQFTAHGVLFAQGGSSGDGSAVFVGDDGAVRWRAKVPANGWATASPVEDRVAISEITRGAQNVRVLDGSGVEVARYPLATSALFVGSGALVTVDVAGVVTWHAR